MAKVLFNIAFTSKYPPHYLSPDRKAEYLARRDFYNLTAEYNYLSYTLEDKKVVKNKDAFQYMFNKGNEEEQEIITGAFNLNGLISPARIEEIKAQLKETESIIWHGVISFDDEVSPGFTEIEKAQKFLKQSFNAFLERTHLDPKNIELVAALHKDTDHAHIHFSFFEKEPKRRNSQGELCYTSKGAFKNNVLENYMVSANMHLSEHSYDYYSSRDRAMAAFKALRANAVEDKYSNAEIRKAVLELANKLPKQGALQYNRKEIVPFQKDIDKVAELIIRTDEEAAAADRAFRAALAAKEAEAQDICTSPVLKKLEYVNNRELQSAEIQQLLREGKTEYIRSNQISWENVDYFERLRQDYKARIGNQVLGMIKDINRDFKPKTRPGTYNDRRKKIEARERRRRSNDVVYAFMQTIGSYQRGVQANFTARLHEIQNTIEEQRMTEQVY